MKKALTVLPIVTALALAAVAYGKTDGSSAPARSSAPAAVDAATVSCSAAQIGFMGPITGPAASIGAEQRNWARFGVTRFDRLLGLRTRMVEFDTQLVASQAATRATQAASNRNIVAVVGPAGSQEVLAVARTFRGLAYMSGSATRTSLTVGPDRIKTFFRTVGNDFAQGRTDARFIRFTLNARRVWIIDDQSAYSVPLADRAQTLLRSYGVSVTRESVNQNQTDFSSIIARIAANTQVVFLPWQLANRAMTFYQQLRTQGKSRIRLVGSDGLDSNDFLGAEGSYFSAFAPDITRSKDRGIQSIIRAYRAKYGNFASTFGPPSYLAVQAELTALKAACKDKRVTRAEMLAQIRKVKIKKSILGGSLAFRSNGDPAAARFYLFQIRNGKPVFVGGA
jgi:branched-chain amino acid transport system substrate-binding protein